MAQTYFACTTCGLSTNVKITKDGKRQQALKRGEDCPVCKKPVTIGPMDKDKVHFTLKAARQAKREREAKESVRPAPRRSREDADVGGGRRIIPRGRHSKPETGPGGSWDPLA